MAQDVKDTKAEKTKRDFGKFFKEVKGELKKVMWPSREQLFNNTVTVLMACFLIGGVIWVADIGLEYAYKAVFNK